MNRRSDTRERLGSATRADPIAQLFQKEANAARSAEGSLRTRVWKFLNSSFGLWLLSSVAIAALVSTVSEVQRCYSTALSTFPKLAKSVSERDMRLLEILLAVSSNKTPQEVNETINDVFTGSKYFYSEFKNSNLLDIEFATTQYLYDMATIGLKETPDADIFSQDLMDEVIASGLRGGKDWDPIIRVFRNDSRYVSKVLSQASWTRWPFVSEDSQKGFDALFKEPPCQAFFLVRDRIKQYSGEF